MLVACVITTMVSLVLAAGSDLRCRLIPNHLPLAIAASFGIAALAEPSAMTVLAAIAVAGGIFVTGLLLFALNILGGGDVKLLAATALWGHWS